MSHFAVMVIGPNVDEQLAPYHQFECTGTVNQYVVNIDRTEEIKEEFARSKRTMVKVPAGTVVAEDKASEIESHPVHGSMVSRYSDFFAVKKEDGTPFPRTEYIVPEGWEVIEVPASELDTFDEWMKDNHSCPLLAEGEEPDLHGTHKWGWYRQNAAGEVTEIIRRTNENYKWDWWQVGGRWSGFLKAKPGATLTGTGRPGVMGSHFAKGEDRVDQAMKKDIDWDGMRNEAGDRAAARWDKAAAATLPEGATEPLTWESWESVRARHEGKADEARRVYHSQPAIEAINKAFGDEFFLQPDEFLTDRATYIQHARDRATVLYAVVMDGKWYAKGEMGWFGMSTDDVTQDEWNRKVNEMIDGLPETVMITVCDCHI